MVITRYKVKAPVKMKAAVVADLHGKYNTELIDALKAEKPDIILVPGDLCTVGEYDDRLVDPERREKRLKTQEGGLEFLKISVNISPVVYSLGNHEWGIDDVYREEVKATGAVLLENKWTKFGDVWIGGQNSAKCGAKYKDGKEITETKEPDIEWLKQSTPGGFKVLLSHHPEYYSLVEPYTDLIVSGHTHGGQWRFFGRGVLAPNQGWFPRYSRGMYENKLVVSAGLTNTTRIPRINNPTELVIIQLTGTGLEENK